MQTFIFLCNFQRALKCYCIQRKDKSLYYTDAVEDGNATGVLQLTTSNHLFSKTSVCHTINFTSRITWGRIFPELTTGEKNEELLRLQRMGAKLLL